jgi:hypothetical protein
MTDIFLTSEDLQYKSDSEKLIINNFTNNQSVSNSLSTQASRNSTKFEESKQEDKYNKTNNNICDDLNLDSVENLKDFILQLSAEYDDLKSKYEFIFSSYEESQNKVHLSQAEVSELKEEVLKLNNKLEIYEIELYADYNHIKRKSKVNSSGKSILFPEMRKSSSLNSYMIKSRSNSYDHEDEVQRELNHLKAEISKKEQEIYNLKNDYEVKFHSMEETYEINLQEYEQENTKLKENLCELQKMEFSLQIKISNLNDKIEALKKENDTIKEEKVSLENLRNKEKFIFRHEKEKFENEIITLQKFLDESNTQFLKLDEVSHHLEKCQKEKDELIKKLKLKDEIVEGLNLQIENLTKEIKLKKSFRDSLPGLNRVRLTLKKYKDIIFEENKSFNESESVFNNQGFLKDKKASNHTDNLDSSCDSQEIPHFEEEENNYKTLHDCLLIFEEEENKKLKNQPVKDQKYPKDLDEEISENITSSDFYPKNLNTHNFFSQISKETVNICNSISNYNSQNFYQKLSINKISNLELFSCNLQFCKEQNNEISISKDLDPDFVELNNTIRELKFTIDDKQKINSDLTEEVSRLNNINDSFNDQILIMKSNLENQKFEKEQELSKYRLRIKKIKECIEKKQYDVVLKTLNNI